MLNGLDGTRTTEELLAFHEDAQALLPILHRERWRAGVRSVLCEFDTVDASNLNRRFLFSTNDIGRPKVEVTARELRRRRPRRRRALRRPRAWSSSGSAINGVARSMLAEAVVRVLAPSLGGPLLLGERLRIALATFAVSRKAISAEGLERRGGERCFCRNAPLAQAG